jgi:hypothetical protein
LAAWHGNDSEAPSLASSHTVTTAEGHSIPKGSRAPVRPQVTETQFLEEIIALDEFFFDMHTDCEQMWLPTDEPPETRERHLISFEKVTVTLVCSPNGSHVIEILPKGHNFNTNYTVHLCLQNSRR